MKVLYVTSEAAPFAKSGGLGDVAGSLPKALKKEGTEIRVILPLYKDMPQKFQDQLEFLGGYEVNLNWRKQNCQIFQLVHEEVTYYFLGNDYYFKRDGLYGYFDEAERYLFFSKAVLEFVPKFGFWPDVLHVNDWQSAAIPFLLNKHYRKHYQYMKTVLTIHNIKYQGIYGRETLMDLLGLKPTELTSDIEFKGDTNLMKAGIYNADHVTTVSPTYARELTHEYYGEGLHGVVKDNQYKMTGILNGIDYDSNHPQKDPHVWVPYTRSLKKKRENKKIFMEELGFQYDDSKPLVGIVSRLDELKGIDLITHVIYEMMQMGIYLVLLGTGESRYESIFREIEHRYPEHASVNITFDSGMASKIYAASDMILMPSRVEPCGLTQIIALKYGAIPLVRKTGGLNDTIQKFDVTTAQGNGFMFNAYNAHEMLSEFKRAVCIYEKNQDLWENLAKNAFQSNYDWTQSAKAYQSIYDQIIEG